jgi:hypothetical protein
LDGGLTELRQAGVVDELPPEGGGP